MFGRSQFVDHGSYVVQHTPDEPKFWFGNQLIYRGLRPWPEMQSAFAATFPNMTHVVFGFDIPTFDPPDWLRQIEGYTFEVSDTLLLNGAVQGPDRPDEIVFREIISDQDWSDLVDLQHVTGVEEGYEPVSHRSFLQEKFQRYRSAVLNGHGAWFGAFDHGLLVADMGIFWSSDLARFQSVETRASHRRRGLCASLLAYVTRLVQSRAPKAQIVILADAAGNAGRIYRRAGFAHVETLYAVYKPGY